MDISLYGADSNVSFGGMKYTVGNPLPNGYFEFAISDITTGGEVVRGFSDDKGQIRFPIVAFTTPGVYRFRMYEVTPGDSNWTADSTASFGITINVTENSKGDLISTVDYPDGFPQFTNSDYRDAGSGLQFPGWCFSKPGTYEYVMSESQNARDGWTLDNSEYRIILTVRDDGQGNLSASYAYPDGYPSFENIYKAYPTILQISGNKNAAGAALAAGQFQFGLFDKDGNLIDTVSNNADGVFRFSGVMFDKVGVYDYSIRELTPNGNGWQTDSASFPITITVKDNSGFLNSAIAYPNGKPVFTNTYSAAPSDVTIYAYKQTPGWNGTDKGWSFILEDVSGKQLYSATSYNGVATFPTISYSAPGTYIYTVYETTPDGGGWTTDTSRHRVVVTVADDGKGQLSTSLAYPDGEPTFTNIYKAAPVSIPVSAKKTSAGAPVADGQFNFGLFDSNGRLVEMMSNDVSGNINFSALRFDAAGSYNYSIRELSLSGGGWKVDPTVWPVVITVSDDQNGRLAADADYPNGSPVFKNVYAVNPICVTVYGKKTAVGGLMADGQFEFTIYDAAGNFVSSTTNQASPTPARSGSPTQARPPYYVKGYSEV